MAAEWMMGPDGLARQVDEFGNPIPGMPGMVPGLGAPTGLTAIDPGAARPGQPGGAPLSGGGKGVTNEPSRGIASAPGITGPGGQGVSDGGSRGVASGAPVNPYSDDDKAGATGSDTTTVPDPMQGHSQGPQYAPRRTRKIPGGDKRVAFAIQRGTALSGEERDAIDAPYDSAVEGLQGNLRELELRQQEQQQARELMNQKRQFQIDNERIRRRGIDRQIEESARTRDLAQKDAEAAAVDPNRFINNMSTTAKVFAGLGILVSGFTEGYAAGLQGRAAGPNQALENFMQLWRDDNERQQIEYEQAKDKADLANNRYAEKLQLYGDPESAKKALEADELALSQSILMSKMQGTQDLAARQNIQMAIAGIEEKKQAINTELDMLEKDKATEQWQNIPDQYITTGGPPKAPKDEGKRRVRLPDGSFAWTADERITPDIQKNINLHSQVIDNLQEMDRLAEEGDRAGAGAVARQTISIMTNASGAGAPNGQEGIDYLNEALGDPGAFFSPRGKARRKASIATARRDQQRTIGTYLNADPAATQPLPGGSVGNRQ